MKSHEIRASFLKFFQAHQHTWVPSSSLVPENDPSLLFTNAGMVQFKESFLGSQVRPFVRATSVQKCLRAGGKHNDLENVGFTARHHTFFEMMGNFSFGDYFKKEAIALAWKFVTQELKIPTENLHVTVFESDQEAAQLWHEQEGVPLDRIHRFGEKDNFWSMGDAGPCGPCTEIFIDRGPAHGCKQASCQMGCSCDRFLEFWNLVFMQYDRASDGSLKDLPKPSVDTGAGLERIAAILQGVESNYETDLFVGLIQQIEHLLQGRTAKKQGVAGGGSDLSLKDAEQAKAQLHGQLNERTVALRVIADHSRAIAFLLSDGVRPSNEGRGYVLRRILRRAIRYGKKIGFLEPFLHETIPFVVAAMAEVYPELERQQAAMRQVVLAEEEQFFVTLERGLELLRQEFVTLGSQTILPGAVAFKLYDTYGFPFDLTVLLCAEKNLQVDEAGFEACMNEQQALSRSHWKGGAAAGGNDRGSEVAVYQTCFERLQAANQTPRFVGYQELEVAASPCLALFQEQQPSGLVAVEAVAAGGDGKSVRVNAIFLETPFYGESGGQLADRGDILQVQDGDFVLQAVVEEVFKPLPELTVVRLQVQQGALRVGLSYRQRVEKPRRAALTRAHTATHLLQAVLQQVLGAHVKQAGSWVGVDLLRFDFSHFQALSEEVLQEVEARMNHLIWQALAVKKVVLPKSEALATGAIAFFGEKYGDQVRVVSVGEVSTEFCGGTHVDASSQIHLFKIEQENGVSAGVRRIVASTSQQAWQFLKQSQETLQQMQETLQVSKWQDLVAKVEKMKLNERDLRSQLGQMQAFKTQAEALELLKQATGSWLVAECPTEAAGVQKLRELASVLLQKQPKLWVVLGMRNFEPGKVALLVARGAEASVGGKSASAKDLLTHLLPAVRGKGGGKADVAQGIGADPEGLPAALESARLWLA